MKKYFTFLVIPVLLLTLIIPQGAQAATTNQTIAKLQQIVMLYQKLLQLRIQLDELQGVSQSGTQTSELSVKTNAVQLLNNSTVKMNGQVTFKDDGDARVWFKYGSTVSLSNKTLWRAIDNKSSGDSFDFSLTLNDLSKNKTYYYRAMAEDENGQVAQGVTKSFTYTSSNSSNNSNNSDNNDEPDVTTGDVTDITQDEARLEGEVDMNDFNNGEVFFVYGEDEDAVDSADNENRYMDIDESGSDLRKIVVSNSFDDSDNFTESVSDLNDDTDIYYRLCVEYTDDSDDDVLTCGDVESFTTESN